MSKPTIIIPAAGAGKRMKSHGAKGLVKLAHGERLIDRQLRILRRLFPDNEFIVVLGYQSTKFLKRIPFWVKTLTNEEYETTNVCHSVELGIKAASASEVIIVFGDLVFNSIAAHPLTLSGSKIVVDNRGYFRPSEIGVNVVGGEATHFSFGMIEYKWGQMVRLDEKELSLLKRFLADPISKRKFLYEGLNYILDKGGSFLTETNNEAKFAEVDCARDIANAMDISKEKY